MFVFVDRIHPTTHDRRILTGVRHGTRLAALLAMVLLTVGGFVLGTASPAHACSCGTLSDAEARQHADAVFVGTLVEIRTPPGEQFSSTDPERFVFDVDAVYKGRVFARQSVVTAREGASCGLEISGPGPFVVFARTSSDGIVRGAVDGELYSNLCSGTRAVSDAALPAAFGAASPPIDGSSPIGSRGSPTRGPVIAIAAGVLVIVVGTAVVVRRRA